MRILGLAFIFCVALTACKKEPKVTDTSAPCMSVTDLDPAYTFEDLTPEYSIAFSPGYTYGGYLVFQGDHFIKKLYTAQDTISFIAQYGPDAGHRSVYGTALANTAAAQIDLEYNDQTYSLKNKKRLCGGGGTIGYYYYTKGLERTTIVPNATNPDVNDTVVKNYGLGIVYLLHDKDFRQNVIINFPESKEQDVNTIVGTIRKK